MESKKIIVAGHICLDLTPAFCCGPVNNISDILQPGSLIRMGKLAMNVGGAVYNTGVAFQKLGNAVSIVAKVGGDSFGQLAIQETQKVLPGNFIKIDEDSSTSYSVVIAPPGIDRIFLHHPGANTTFSLDDVDLDQFTDVDLFHLGYPPLLDLLIENDGIALKQLMKAVKSRHITTSIDMVAIDPQSKVAKLNWNAIIGNFIPYTDFFLPSAEELAFMIDRPLYDEWKHKSQSKDIIDFIDIDRDLTSLSDRLLAMGGKNIIIKCGHRGIYFRNKDVEYFRESFIPQSVVSATGAGDVAIAGFLTSWLNGKSLPDSLEMACGMGASCVEQVDFASGFKGFSEVRQRIDAGWATNQLALNNWEKIQNGLWQR